MSFTINAIDKGSAARAGTLLTAHGDVKTPVFMPVGTQATVKSVELGLLESMTHVQTILANTYHLYLRPGHEIISAAGGLHKFMNWSKPILTDSGGFQVYSLGQITKITEKGAKFKSHIDGSAHLFTPEYATEIQRHLGADVIMAFDECTPYPCDRRYVESSMALTHRWLNRCITYFDQNPPLHGYQQILAPIVQGSTFRDLRIASAEFVASRDRAINAIGGLSVGEPAEEMYAMAETVCGVLPTDRPRYLMGVGTPQNLLECVALGVDMFDCVLPSRNARHGMLYTYEGSLHIKNEKWKRDFSPIDAQGSPLSRRYSKAYLRHLVHAKELVGATICTLQNLYFFQDLLARAREHILAGTFDQWKSRLLPKLLTQL